MINAIIKPDAMANEGPVGSPADWLHVTIGSFDGNGKRMNRLRELVTAILLTLMANFSARKSSGSRNANQTVNRNGTHDSSAP